MGVEIERKFLVDHNQWQQLSKPHGNKFRQGYLLKEEAKTIRIRVTDDHAYITIKGKSTGFSRSEFEYEIAVEEGEQLLAEFCENVISKTRYCITYGGKLWEVDVFSGSNEGLVIAEIELNEESDQFEKPAWVTAEVTGDEKYYNSSLSVNPYKNWP